MHRALVLIALLLPVVQVEAQPAPLALVQTIPLPGVEGRIDHMALDAGGHRLFVAALGNNTVEVVDLKTGKDTHSIHGLHEPQGIVFLPKTDRIAVTNGGNGVCDFFDGRSFHLLKSVAFSDDADNIRYDQEKERLYLSYGDGGIGVVDGVTGDILYRIRLAGHPESFQLEHSGSRIFVNVPDAGRIEVIDRKKRAVTAVWSVPDARANFPMALDEADHRLFVGCWDPTRLLVYNTETGKVVTSLTIAGDVDDLYYDTKRRRIYASCGQGYIDVVQQAGPDDYRIAAKLPTAIEARTSLFAPEQDRLYLAVPHRGSQQAEVRVYTAE